MRVGLVATRSFSVKSNAAQMLPSLLKPFASASSIKLSGLSEIRMNYSTESEGIKEKFDALVKDKDVVVFMKGKSVRTKVNFKLFLWLIFDF